MSHDGLRAVGHLRDLVGEEVAGKVHYGGQCEAEVHAVAACEGARDYEDGAEQG